MNTVVAASLEVEELVALFKQEPFDSKNKICINFGEDLTKRNKVVNILRSEKVLFWPTMNFVFEH
jgi:hypothetical protein